MAIIVNNLQASYDAVDYLTGLGHKKDCFYWWRPTRYYFWKREIQGLSNSIKRS